MSFSLSIGRWAKQTVERQDNVRRAVILKLFTSVIRDTPVDTGRLRAAWNTSVGNPDISQPPPDLPSYNTSEVFGQVQSAATNSNNKDVVILCNSLPYASRIEYDGWSHTKAPQGMVRRNVARFRQLLSSEVHKFS
jgi:hypothetical protein